MPPPKLSVAVRRVRPDDESVIRPMWEAGFCEMIPHSYDRISASIIPALATAAVAGTLFALGAPRAAVVCGILGSCIYLPPGKLLHDTLFRFAIAQSAKSQMANLPATWNEKAGAAFFVAVDKISEEVIGCVGVRLTHTLWKEVEKSVVQPDREASVWRLSVSDAARGRHVGRELMHSAETWAREHGARHVSLICGNPESKIFYRKLEYSAETEERARRVLFGAADARPQTVTGKLRELWLARRLAPETATVLAREIA
jgi:ribosomal protein S18 acetylase RimI-like enzyme